MFHTECLILLSVLSLSLTQPLLHRKSVTIKLPTDITNGTYISITGEMGKDRLFISITGKRTDEKCNIRILPTQNTIKVVPSDDDDVTYDLNHSGNGPVPFTLNITARTAIDSTISNFLDLVFEGNAAGPELLPSCEIKNFQNFQKININGIHHLKSLLFEYDKHIT